MTSRGDLRTAQGTWNRARRDHERARLALERAIVKAARGGMSQSEIARTLDWPRQRVSVLLSKHVT